jgi:hypothetical protein
MFNPSLTYSMNPTPINPERITAEAQKAAWLYDTTTQANPYPWNSPEADIFCKEFEAAKQAMAGSYVPAPKVQAPRHDKLQGTYTTPFGTYYRNDGNPHVPSRGVGC